MLKIIKTVHEFNIWRNNLSSDLSVGLVPTMGNLHLGHLSLTKMSLESNDVTIVTIFVNPKQFGPNEDLDKYPRTLTQDTQKLEELFNNVAPEKELCILAPSSPQEIYPEDEIESKASIIVKHPMTEVLCGAYRPGHFDGVTTVVHKLFTITKPHNAYFGEKDYQQLAIIRQMVKETKLPVNIFSRSIIRDKDGLALSSRNQYLSVQERKIALTLPQTLNELKKMAQTKKVDLLGRVKEIKESDHRWQYLEALDATTLAPLNESSSDNIVIAGAYIVGNTRLIDNVVVD
jgi:pantoate--beta-alanine ligase